MCSTMNYVSIEVLSVYVLDETPCRDDWDCKTEDCHYCHSDGVCRLYYSKWCDLYDCGEGDGGCDPGQCPTGFYCGVDNFLEYHSLLRVHGCAEWADACVKIGNVKCCLFKTVLFNEKTFVIIRNIDEVTL